MRVRRALINAPARPKTAEDTALLIVCRVANGERSAA
jgi:hypothetical protein